MAQEPPLQEPLPAVPPVRAAEERALHRLVPVDGGDAEVVPLAAIEVEDDGAEPERLRDRAGDQREDGRQVTLGAHELRHAEERADPGELLRPAPQPGPRRALKPWQAREPQSAQAAAALSGDSVGSVKRRGIPGTLAAADQLLLLRRRGGRRMSKHRPAGRGRASLD